jgi:uncharacterized membrane protein YcgQ (UPF0703/DUF1980 family)
MIRGLNRSMALCAYVHMCLSSLCAYVFIILMCICVYHPYVHMCLSSLCAYVFIILIVFRHKACLSGLNVRYVYVMHKTCFKLGLQSPLVSSFTTRYNIQQPYVLPTQCICVFCIDFRTNSDYLPM